MIGILTNQKGGVAKTTNTIHIASALAQKNHKVLIIDMDPQCDLTHGVAAGSKSYDIIDFLENKPNFSVEEKAPNFYILQGNEDFISNKYNINVLEKALNKKQKSGISVNTYFDFIFIDAPPSKIIPNSLLKNHQYSEVEIALYASDFFLIPLEAKEYVIKNADKFLGRIFTFMTDYNRKIAFLGFFFGVILETSNSKKYYEKIFKKHSTNFLFDNYIRQDIEVEKAVRYGKTIFQHKPNSRAAKDYIELTNEFLKSPKIIYND